MRETLNFPQIDKQKLEKVKTLIDSIAENNNNNCDDELKQLNYITGKSHEAIEFAEYWGWTDLDVLAEKTLIAEPPCIQDLTKDEVQEIVAIIKESMVLCEDVKAEYYMELLHRSLPLEDVEAYIMSDNNTENITDNMMAAASNSIIYL